jgi:hypothetical protein
MKIWKQVVSLAVMSMVTYGGAMGEDKPADKATAQMEKLGALRGRLMLKLPELGKVVDRDQNGANATYAAVERIWTQVSGATEKSLQEENAKEPEMQNRLFVKTLSEKGQTLAAMWNEFTQKGWPTHQKTSDKLRGEFEALNQVFASLKDAEMTWHASGLDLGGLIGVLTAIDSRADAIKDQATAAVSNLKVALSVWEAMAK